MQTQNVHLARLTNILIEFVELEGVSCRRVASLPIRIPNRVSPCTLSVPNPIPVFRRLGPWDRVYPPPSPSRPKHTAAPDLIAT